MPPKSKYAPGVPRFQALAAALAAALVAAGCGTTTKDTAADFQGTQKPVAQAVEDLQKAAEKSDEAKICSDLLATDLVTKIKASGQPCVNAIHDALADADALELEVTKVSVNGTNATAVVKSTGAGDQNTTDTLN